MNIICNKIEFANYNDSVPSYTVLSNINNIVYSNETDPNTDAGNLRKETVTVEAFSKDVQALINSREFYILRLWKDNEAFIVGSVNFPAKKTIQDNKVNATITFECSSPA